jgi:hypothetical protein
MRVGVCTGKQSKILKFPVGYRNNFYSKGDKIKYPGYKMSALTAFFITFISITLAQRKRKPIYYLTSTLGEEHGEMAILPV